MATVVATESFFHFTKKGGMNAIKEGETVKSTAAVVKANPEKFIPADEWLEGAQKKHVAFGPVEQATAAPGETRSVKKPKKATVEDADVDDSVE